MGLGFTMGVALRSGPYAVVSYPQTEMAGQPVQVVSLAGGDWASAEGPWEPGTPPLAAEGKPVWCAKRDGCWVDASHEIRRPSRIGSQPCGKPMGVFVADTSAWVRRWVVSYPYVDNLGGYVVQSVAMDGEGWSLTPPAEGTCAGGNASANPWVDIPAGAVALSRDGSRCYESVGGFRVQKFEVSNADYLRCHQAGVCSVPRWHFHWNWPAEGSSQWPSPEAAKLPVIGLTRDMARTYCAYVGARLPSEAEWTRAARGSSAQPFPWGWKADPAKANVFETGLGKLVAVDALAEGASLFGVQNLIGNAREWVFDTRPTCAEPRARAEQLVAKGGGLNDSLESSHLDARLGQAQESFPYVGVRCAARAR